MEAGVLWREEVQTLKDKEYKSAELNHMLLIIVQLNFYETQNNLT